MKKKIKLFFSSDVIVQTLYNIHMYPRSPDFRFTKIIEHTWV